MFIFQTVGFVPCHLCNELFFMPQFFIAVLDAGLDCWPLLFVAGLLRDMKNICTCVPYLRAECRGLGKQMCVDSVSANGWKV